MKELSDVKKEFKALFFSTLPCLLALGVICIYTQEIFPNLTLGAVDLICLFMVSLKIIQGISEKVNIKKAKDFTLTLIISMAALGMNLEWTIPASLAGLSARAMVWCGFLLADSVCLIVVLIRVLFWGQKEWEKLMEDVQAQRREKKKNKEERRRECLEYRRRRIGAWKTYSQERSEILHKYRKEQLENHEELQSLREKIKLNNKKARWEHETRLAELERIHKAQMDEVRRKGEMEIEKIRWEKRKAGVISGSHMDEEETFGKKIGRSRFIDLLLTVMLVASIVLVLYLFPIMMTGGITAADGTPGQGNITNQTVAIDGDIPIGHFHQWLQAVRAMMGTQGQDSADSAIRIILVYLVLMAIVIFILLLFGYILYSVIRKFRLRRKNDLKDDDLDVFHLLDEYAIPIALLLTSLLALYVLSGEDNVLTITSSWGNLVMAIFLIMLLLVAFEMVRLVLEQCGHSESLLKRILKLIFIAILYFLLQIIFGVLKSLQIENLITSLFTTVLPEDRDGLPAYILEKIQMMLRSEVDKVNKSTNSLHTEIRGHRIWKRR